MEVPEEDYDIGFSTPDGDFVEFPREYYGEIISLDRLICKSPRETPGIFATHVIFTYHAYLFVFF